LESRGSQARAPRDRLSEVRRCPRVFRRPARSYERRIAVGGLTGWYTDFGAGAGVADPVVILATTLARGRSYAWTIDCLAPHFRVITVEMPGCGRGSATPGPWGFVQYAQWAVRFLDATGLSRVTLVGHSNSAGAALVVAANHPERVGHLVLADSVGSGKAPSVPRVIAGRSIDALIEHRLTLVGWHHVVYNALFQPADFFHQIWLSVHEDLKRYAARVRAPTLIAWGKQDFTLPLRCGRTLKEVIPGAELYVSRGGSHDWIIDRAPEFAAAVRGFLDRVASAGCGACPV